jgi:hypothetical protein
VRRVLPHVVLIVSVGLGLLLSTNVASAGKSRERHYAPVDIAQPTVSGTPQAGSVLRFSAGRWRGAARFVYLWKACNRAGARCAVIRRQKIQVKNPPVQTYRLTRNDVGHTIRVTAVAINRWGSKSATSRATAVVKSSGSGTTTPPAPPPAPPENNPPATVSSATPEAVYVGYYDTHHANNLPKPDPWQGSPNVVFEGAPDSGSGGWDSGAVRVDDLSGASLPFVSITVDIGSYHFALWDTVSLASGQTLIVAQTAFQNFDTSDTSPAGCYGCDPSLCTTDVVSTVPVVHVTVDGTTTDYPDTNQVLNTKGVDGAGCPDTGVRNDESQTWQPLASGP